MTLQIGIIAEDKSDVDVIRVLLEKMATREFSVRSFVGKGCGKLKSKAGLWATTLQLQGCNRIILVHDLDDEKLNTLRQDLLTRIEACGIKHKTVVIPVREIEAWLLADNVAIRKTFNLRVHVPLVSNSESIADPKRKLAGLVERYSNKRRQYFHTVDNLRIAENCSVEKLYRCKSFLDLRIFAEACL